MTANDAAKRYSPKATGVPQRPVTKAEPAWASKGDQSPRALGRIPTNLGPSAEGWARTVMIFLLIVVVAGLSRYGIALATAPSTVVTHLG